MMTREDYMSPIRRDRAHGWELHRRYFGEVALESGLWQYIDKALAERCAAALAAGDDTLNSIPLASWDSLAYQTKRDVTPALKRRGDFWSLGEGVCALKEAARQKVEANAKGRVTLRYGTPFFVDEAAAVYYYEKQGEGGDSVRRKIAEREIVVGELPPVKPNETIWLHKGEGRYHIDVHGGTD